MPKKNVEVTVAGGGMSPDPKPSAAAIPPVNPGKSDAVPEHVGTEQTKPSRRRSKK